MPLFDVLIPLLSDVNNLRYFYAFNSCRADTIIDLNSEVRFPFILILYSRKSKTEADLLVFRKVFLHFKKVKAILTDLKVLRECHKIIFCEYKLLIMANYFECLENLILFSSSFALEFCFLMSCNICLVTL